MGDDNLYTIKTGDNFWSLENEWNMPHGTLQKLNPELNPRKLKVGQKIKMPTLVYWVMKKMPERKLPHYIDSYRDEITMPIDNLRIHQPLGFASGVGRIRPNNYNNKDSNIEDYFSISIGVAGTTNSAILEYLENKVRTSFKTGRNPVSWSKLTPRQQAWRTANILGKNAKYIKYTKTLGVIGTGISVGMAGYDIASGEGTMIDYIDVSVGVTSIGAVIFLASNPVGWVIGAGSAIYFTGRLVYDIYEDANN